MTHYVCTSLFYILLSFVLCGCQSFIKESYYYYYFCGLNWIL